MRIFLFIFFFSLSYSFKAQENNSTHKKKPSKHAVIFIICHTEINEGLDENGEKQWLSLPSWGISYNYSISQKWAIGLHSDIILEDFVVNNH